MTTGKELVAKDAPEIEASHPEMTQMQARAIGKFAESSTLELTPQQIEILHQPIPIEEILTRPDGMIYLDWGWYSNVLDQAFGTGHWSLTPAPWNPKLYREGNITYREFCLWVDGRFAANAIGHHEETRKTANFGDAAEATYANALTRCCKRLGVARDLWRKNKIEVLKRQMKAGARPAPPEVIEATEVAPVMPDQVEGMKFALKSAGTIAELKSAWDAVYKRKDALSPATFEILSDLKDTRKKALAESERCEPRTP